MANKNILTIPVGVLQEASYLYAQTGEEFIRIPAKAILDLIPEDIGGGLEKVPDNYVYVENADGDSENDIPESGFEPTLDAHTFRGYAPEDFSMMNAVMRKNTFRGANLGSEFTTKQKAAIADGSFSEFFIGDYWEKDGIRWRIVDMNYWINTGRMANLCKTNHLVIMPDGPIVVSKMNDTAITTGGYRSTKVHLQILTNASSEVVIKINDMFGGGSILIHDVILCTSVDANGRPNSGTWEMLALILPNELMMYGNHIFTPTNNGEIIPYLYDIDKTQLALFRLNPVYISIGINYWLRDVVSASKFAKVDNTGLSYASSAAESYGIRPVFGITGA